MRPHHASKRTLRIAGIVVAVVAIAIGEGLWGTTIANSADATVTTAPTSQGESLPASPPLQRAPARSALNKSLSSDLSDYLHQHHLPFVDALVFSNAAGQATSVKLSGQVRTEHGKEDAETKSRDFISESASGMRIQNHIEVDAGLASSPPALIPAVSSSAPAESAPAAGAAPDPCTNLCLQDEGHCNSSCQTQAAGSASSGGFSLPAIVGQFGQSATQMKQCNEACQQTREHCAYQCGQSGGSEQPSADAAPPSDSGGPQPYASDHRSDRSEGPDTPPE